MAGSKGKVGKSLQLRLSSWVSIILIVMGISAGAFSFVSAYHEAIELQDDQLGDLKTLIVQKHLSLSNGQNQNYVFPTEPESFLIARFSSTETLPLSKDERELFEKTQSLPEGLQTISFQDRDWRIVLNRGEDGSRLIVGQQTEVRDDAAMDAGVQTLLPILILIPLLLFAVRALVRGMFTPLTALAVKLDASQAHGVAELGISDVPSEIQPFVSALNRLFARLASAAAFQRRFVADAAHELRSPLTALSLQAERLDAGKLDTQEAEERLTLLRSGIARTRALLDQLLNFARAQEERLDKNKASLSLQSVLRLVLEDLQPIAEAKNIDIGFVGTQDALVMASEAEIVSIMKNLIDNALRYTPDGGRVDMTIETTADGSVFQIDDTGPGIPPEERDRVFDPFYRMLGSDVSGSGLGLSIVKATVERIGAKIHLDYTDAAQRNGLRVCIVFPYRSEKQ